MQNYNSGIAWKTGLLINNMMKLLKLLGMRSYKKASQLASDAQEHSLSVVEKISVYTHLLTCKSCLNCSKHLEFLRKAAKSVNDKVPPEAGVGMSDSAHDRIRQQLRQK